MTWNRFGTVPEYWAGLCGYVNLCDPIPRQPKEMRMAPHIIWVWWVVSFRRKPDCRQNIVRTEKEKAQIDDMM